MGILIDLICAAVLLVFGAATALVMVATRLRRTRALTKLADERRTVGEYARYYLFLGTAVEAERFARLGGYPQRIVIPLQAALGAALWGRRGPIGIVGDWNYVKQLPPRERAQAEQAIERVYAINSVEAHQQPGGGDA